MIRRSGGPSASTSSFRLPCQPTVRGRLPRMLDGPVIRCSRIVVGTLSDVILGSDVAVGDDMTSLLSIDIHGMEMSTTAGLSRSTSVIRLGEADC